LIHTRGVLNNGDTLAYAFGNTIATRRGLRVVEHGGAMMGYKAYILRFPDQHFSVLATCNLGAIDPGPLAHAVADVFLADRMTAEAPRAVAQTGPRQAGASSTSGAITSAELAAFAGDYFSEDLGVTYRVLRSGDGGLLLQSPAAPAIALVPTTANTFRAGSTTVQFEVTANSRNAPAMILTVSRIGEMRLVRRP